jgi:deoxyribodipyrimidine photolyase-like uncharacterized protein
MLTMSPTDVWKEVFTNWPTSLARRGIVITTLNESTPFKGFMIRDEMLLLERTNPDPLGARYVLIGFDAINCVKLTDVVKESVFASAGFTGKFAGM